MNSVGRNGVVTRETEGRVELSLQGLMGPL